MLAPLARQSPGCRERSARGPGPGHRTPYRTRPSLELGQLPTSDTAPDTAPHRAGHYNGHYFPAPDIAPSPPPPALDACPPPPPGAQTPSPLQAPASDPLHPSARHHLLPLPDSLSLLPPHLSPARVGAPPVSPTPCSSASAARTPIPRLLARMPLPGGLWWLLCCHRGFTLLHRDYGDGELSGDGDEDEDEETFELRTPSPAGGGRVSPRGVWSLVSTPLTTTGRQA